MNSDFAPIQSLEQPASENEVATARLLDLPAELLLFICRHLKPIDLANLAQVSVRLNEVAEENQIWQSLFYENIPAYRPDLDNPRPAARSYRNLYLAHNPYWFIPRSKIWISDRYQHGKLIIARYSMSRGVIEAYEMTATRGSNGLEFWEHNTDVIIHHFEPRVQLDLNRPILRIAAASSQNFPSDDQRFQREIQMNVEVEHQGAAMYRQLGLCKAASSAEIDEDTYWPHRNIPASERVYGDCPDGLQMRTRLPLRLSEICENAFSVRRWIEFNSSYGVSNMRLGEEVNIYATLAAADYTPTLQKPWRGIWVGDYAGHGCEFLLVLQPDEDVELPQGVQDILSSLGRRRRMSSGSEVSWRTALDELPDGMDSDDEYLLSAASDEWAGIASPQDDAVSSTTANTVYNPPIDNPAEGNSVPREIEYSGQLLGIKLTGDPNVPRGEYTFIAPDISPQGTVRIAQEKPFKGARVVRSCGHIASTNYVDGMFSDRLNLFLNASTPKYIKLTAPSDLYIPSQLIMVSEDTLAQYWEAFGHISFYKRVNIDEFIVCD